MGCIQSSQHTVGCHTIAASSNECQCVWATRIILYLSDCIDFSGVDSGSGTAQSSQLAGSEQITLFTRVTPVQQSSVGCDYMSRLYGAIVSYSASTFKKRQTTE